MKKSGIWGLSTNKDKWITLEKNWMSRTCGNSPAGLTSEKKVPTFLPSTMSVITWPVTLGCVPLAMTTDVPPWRAQRAALTWSLLNTDCQFQLLILTTSYIVCAYLRYSFCSQHLSFHSSNANPGLCTVGYGMLVPRVKCVQELGIIWPWRAVVKAWKVW